MKQREIKFRAFSTDNKKMIYQNENGFFSCLYKWKGNNQSCQLAVALKEPTVSVMQFIGLTDKNGVDIYESDIVHINGYADNNHHEVVWVGGGFTAESKHGCMYNVPRNEAEVIGNIHQNPELLK